uniref:Retrovirus-related Pol polyprotein n=1 Tax=Tanacetum cinerariifolium TaxID=118510 RepID=A0A699H9U8_TANCI|nr:retrovirus-related Pol polyprotein [Tanacetum cinerariifolium]
MTVVTNEENELVSTRTVIGWLDSIDYRKLNEATQKDHFPLLFMDQMLERLAGNKFFCFFDGFFGYFQILIEPADQEKITFTCPNGTYVYKHMSFGLCNAPATFNRCMIAIFQDMLETSMEVFKDDYSVFGDSFDSCLVNLEQMLVRCKHAHLVLNWEKCHFIVTEGIVLGHKISSAGLEFDKEKSISYLVLSNIIIFTDHYALKYLFAKQDAKQRLIRWILLLQEFDIKIKNKKGAENVAANHLSRLENPYLEELGDDDIDDKFPDKNLMNISSTKEDKIPWFADFANYLVGKLLRKGLTYAQRCKFFSKLKHYYWDEPYLFKMCPDRMIRRCVYGAGTQNILDECHHGPTKGHYGPSTTTKKILMLFKAPKLRSKWYRLFVVKHGFSSGDVELYDKHEGSFIVNGHRVKLYNDEEQINELTTKEIYLMCEQGEMKAILFMAPFLTDYRETMPWVAEKPFIYSVVENTCNEAKLYDLDETGEGIAKGKMKLKKYESG